MKLKLSIFMLFIMSMFVYCAYSETDKEIFQNGFFRLLNDPPNCVADAEINMYDANRTKIRCQTYFNMFDWYRVVGKIYGHGGNTYTLNLLTSRAQKWDYASIVPDIKYPAFNIGGAELGFYAFEMMPYPFAWFMEKFQPSKIPNMEELLAKANIRQVDYDGAPCLYGTVDFNYGKGAVWISYENSLPLQIQIPIDSGQNILTLKFKNYREISPRMVPFSCEAYIGGVFCWQSTLNNIKLGVDMPMDIFDPKFFNKKDVEQSFKEYALLNKLRDENKNNPEAQSPSPSKQNIVTPQSGASVATPTQETSQTKQDMRQKKNKGGIKIFFVIILFIGAAALVYFYIYKYKAVEKK